MRMTLVSGADFTIQHQRRWKDFLAKNQTQIRRRREGNSYFHELVNGLIKAQVAPDSVIVDFGCSDGKTLEACQPRGGIGIDIDGDALIQAAEKCPKVSFHNSWIESMEIHNGSIPEYVIASLIFDQVYDVSSVMKQIRELSDSETKLIAVTYNRAWQPFLKLAERLRIKIKGPQENYVPWREVENLLELNGFEVVTRKDGILVPVHIPIIANWVNRWISSLPIFRHLALVRVTVARPLEIPTVKINSVSVIVAARNEQGNIADLVERVPIMAAYQELIFVEGGSKDDTWNEILKVAESKSSPTHRIIAIQQTGTGKGDAVRAGFAKASGEVLMILDADLSVPPEELPQFVDAIERNYCQFANGSRLVYPMDDKAMRFLNLLGNKFFGALFTFLLSQPVRDTLCGTKVLRKSDYEIIANNRAFFGDFDPFGDFDLLFGAARLGLKIRDVPVHYKERTYGETNISRFSHGLLLFKMSWVAAKKLRFPRLLPAK
jgi:hypothetical protein